MWTTDDGQSFYGSYNGLNDKERTDMPNHYFAVDGNYGDADGLVIVDTSDWDDDDWAAIDFARDSDKARIAKAIADGVDPDDI